MKARIVHTKIWQDSFFADLTPTEKLVFLHLLTNDRINIIHCYELPERVIAFETGVGRDVVSSAKQKLIEAGKIRCYKDWVHLVNADRYQQFTGEKNELAKQREARLMPDDVFSWYKGKYDTPINTPIDGVSIPSVTSNQYSVINKKGGVGENNPTASLSYLEHIPDDDLEAFADKYKLTESIVQRKAEELYHYCTSKGKVYRDYRALLMGALSRDADKLREKDDNKRHDFKVWNAKQMQADRIRSEKGQS